MPKMKAHPPSAVPPSLEVKDILTELGWTNVEAGRRMNVHHNSISRYQHGGKVPGPVLAYLRLIRQLKRLAR